MSNFALGSVSIKGNGVMIGLNDIGSVDGHCQLGFDGAWGDTINPDFEFAKFGRLLFRQMNDSGFGSAVGNPQSART